MRYSKKFKLKLLKHFNTGKLSISKIAHKEKIPKQTLARWIKLYRKFGERGLENRKFGAKETLIDSKIVEKALQLWKEGKRSKYRMYKDLRTKGFIISKWQIQKIYKKYRLIY